MSDIEHICPNGHEVPVLQPLPCPSCGAGVAYEPCSVGMALATQLHEAVVALEQITSSPAAAFDKGHRSEVARIAREALDRLKGR
jgi:hypothetical protein